MSSKKDIFKDYLNPTIGLVHYNKLNDVINNLQYPWDMHNKITKEDFIPTYKNVTLYFKDADKLVMVPDKKRKGGNVNLNMIYFI